MMPVAYLDDGHTLIVVDAARRRPGRGRLRTLWCSRRSLPQFVPLSAPPAGAILWASCAPHA